MLRQFITLCLERGRKCNVVSLGAGSDTAFWRLCREWEDLAPNKETAKINCYIEVDFEDIVARKSHIIR